MDLDHSILEFLASALVESFHHQATEDAKYLQATGHPCQDLAVSSGDQIPLSSLARQERGEWKAEEYSVT